MASLRSSGGLSARSVSSQKTGGRQGASQGSHAGGSFGGYSGGSFVGGVGSSLAGGAVGSLPARSVASQKTGSRQGASQGSHAGSSYGGYAGGSFVGGAGSSSAGGAVGSFVGGGVVGSEHGGQWGQWNQWSQASHEDQWSHASQPHSEGLLDAGEKATMQNLNDRLANYLEKVKELEDANAELERKIKEWYESHRSALVETDYSKYFKQIADLQAKILEAQVAKASIVLQIDNARLAAEDFKLKYETELMLCQSVETDINGLRRVLDELTLSKSDLESELESLTEELAALKKNHEEEMKAHQNDSQGDVSVEMHAAPGINLLALLTQTREQYERMAEENRRRAEEDFNQRSAELKQQISSGVEQVQSSKTEVSELRRSMQALEIEMQAQLAMKSTLEMDLAETEGTYCSQLAELQAKISIVEEQLVELREETERQSDEYNLLLDIKSRLEQEIATYQRLLEGSGGYSQVSQTKQQSDSGSKGYSSGGRSSYGGSSGYDRGSGTSSSAKEPIRTTRVITVTEDLVDGKPVSTKRQVQDHQ
ncbi:keratin, type I cytoskeletal 12-like [Lissotriton helveticus]